MTWKKAPWPLQGIFLQFWRFLSSGGTRIFFFFLWGRGHWGAKVCSWEAKISKLNENGWFLQLFCSAEGRGRENTTPYSLSYHHCFCSGGYGITKSWEWYWEKKIVLPSLVQVSLPSKGRFKGAWSFLFSFFSKLLRFWYHKNCHIFLIIILKFHALIPLRLEENCKNSPILLIWW